MNTRRVTPNKKYILIAIGLFALIIPITALIILTLTGTNTANTTTNITNTTPIGNAPSTIPSTDIYVKLPLTFHNIIPGKSNESTVINTLGKPIQTAHQGDYTILYFTTKGTYRYNVLVFKNDIVQYIIEQKPTLPPLFSQYKSQTNQHEDGILYDANKDGSGINLYTFAQKGIAFADNPDTNQTNQVHYFIPENYQTFLLSEEVYLNFLIAPTN